MAETGEVKMYTDFKSPYAFLAFDPAYELEPVSRQRLGRRHRVDL